MSELGVPSCLWLLFFSNILENKGLHLLQERLFKQTLPITFNSANTHHQSYVFYREETIARANI